MLININHYFNFRLILILNIILTFFLNLWRWAISRLGLFDNTLNKKLALKAGQQIRQYSINKTFQPTFKSVATDFNANSLFLRLILSTLPIFLNGRRVFLSRLLSLSSLIFFLLPIITHPRHTKLSSVIRLFQVMVRCLKD